MRRFAYVTGALAGAGLLVLLLSLVVNAQIPTRASADVFKVPDDYPTIQAAIDAAAAGDEIWVATGIYTENLSISKGLALSGGWYSPGFITRTLGATIIDGDGAGRVISITLASSAPVTIDGFTIQDGDATGLKLATVAPDTPFEEPGPERAGAERAARNPDLRSPSERAADLRARLADLTARGLYRGSPDDARALLARLDRLTLQAERARARAEMAEAQPQIQPQQTGGSGGGVYSENAALQLLNCTIIDNVATEEGEGAGGGVFVNGAPENGLRIADNSVGWNVASISGDGWGGGIFVYDAPGGVIEDNVVEENIAAWEGNGYGGGLYLYESGDVVVRGNEVRQNLGAQAGELNDGIGGGLGLDACPGAALHDNLLELNTASAAWNGYRGLGGGLFVTESEGADVRDNTVSENLALLNGITAAGGGIQFMWSSNAQVEGNQITGNVAALYSGDAQGGGIKVGGVYSTSLTGNEIHDNTAVIYGDVAPSSFGHYGGGAYAVAYEKSLLGDNEISGNATCTYCPLMGGFGGGAYVGASDGAVAAGNTIADNASALIDGVGVGGGLQLRDTTGSQVLRNRITGNQAGMAAGSHDGGLTLDHLEGSTASAVVDGNVIIGNWSGGNPESATSTGGGSVDGMEDGLTFINNVVANNHALEWGGFALVDLYDGGQVINNTFAGNGDIGLLVIGTALTRTTNVTLTNNIIVSHTVGLKADDGAAAMLSYTLWNGNGADTGGAGTITETHSVTGDPAFVKPAADDYSLTIASVARDAGDPAGVPPAPDHDADGVARPQGLAVDIGAYEWKGHWLYLPAVSR